MKLTLGYNCPSRGHVELLQSIITARLKVIDDTRIKDDSGHTTGRSVAPLQKRPWRGVRSTGLSLR